MTVDHATPEIERSRADADRAAGRRPAAARGGPEADHDRRQRAARARRPLRRHGRRRPARAAPAAAPTCPTRSSRSTTTPASSATAACAPATTSRATTSSAAAARATPPASRSTSNDPMGASSCVTCGECVAACPTGALTNKPIHDIPIRPRTELDAVDSVCPYCGVGCALTYYVDRERGAIAFAEGRDQPGSQGRLCVKGRYGWDYAASPQRLTVPLIRLDDVLPQGAAVGATCAATRTVGRRGRQRPQARRPGALRRGAAALPGGQLGRGARPGRAAAARDPRRAAAPTASPASARPSAPTRRPTSSRS